MIRNSDDFNIEMAPRKSLKRKYSVPLSDISKSLFSNDECSISENEESVDDSVYSSIGFQSFLFILCIL